MERLAGHPVEPVNYDRVPSATYCRPETAGVGLTESEAKKRGYDVKVGRFPWTANGKANILGNTTGFVKVVTEKKYGEILGVHIIGPAATELVAAAGIAISHEATAESVFGTIHAHPTLSEAIMEAAADSLGLAINF